MTIHVNIDELKARLSELLARVEAGEDLVIAQEGRARFKLERLDDDRVAARATVEALLADRTSGEISVEDIIAWRDEGRR